MVDDKEIELEIDTGAPSVISELFPARFPERPLDVAKVKLTTSTGEVIPMLGQFEATVS